MTSNIFQDIMDRVDLKDLVRFNGLEVDRGGFVCCPFHNERHPSFKVYEDHYHCFGCGEHGDHVDLVQKLYGLSNIEAAKLINKDFGLGLETGEIAKPINPRPRKNDEFKLWLGESVHTLIEYKKLLAYWERIYDPRSPIDNVNDRYLESIHNKAYVEHCVDTLLFGSEQEKRKFYETDREYPKRIKKRLDELDVVSRKAPKRAV
ncbi:MAG: DNA primase [Ruminococcus sp.]|nr:DNA primase [Ruminococcus sp.]